MDSNTVSPEEFRQLKMQVDILQRFLTKTFGSSFLEFCKEAQASMTKGNNKPLPMLNKAQINPPTSSQSNGNVKVVKSQATNGNSTVSSNGTGRVVANNRRPPPLLHRPISGKLEPRPSTSSSSITYSKNTTTSVVIEADNDTENGDQGEYFDDGNEDVVQFLQPETVFSDDENQVNNVTPPKKPSKVPEPKLKLHTQTSVRNGIKREHAVAFYDAEDEQTEMTLPEGTECIVVESDDDPGQHENYMYKQDDDEEEDEEYYDDGTNEEMYEEGYSYNMVEDGVEVTPEEGNTENYQAEELKTDGNVTFGTVYTDPSTGMQYFQCAFCPSAKVFKHKQSLKEHYLLNHSPTPPAFQCQCGRRFLKQSQLKRHEVVHTSERPYVCPICLKDFTRKDNMTVHMVRNHAEKKHPCPYCPDKVYATPAEVNRHLRMYHSQWQQ